MILAQDAELVAKLETAEDLAGTLAKQTASDISGFRVLFRSVANFQPKRHVYECFAISLNGDKPKA